MRVLALVICLVMVGGLDVIAVDAGSGLHGRRRERQDSDHRGGGAEAEAPGDNLRLPEKIDALMKAGKYRQAQRLARVLLQRRERRFGPDAPEVAGGLQLLGNIDMGMRQFLKAIELYQRALQIREKALGPDDPKTAATLAQLGLAYTEIGSYDKALPLVQRSLNIREKVLGSDAPGTAGSLDILANLKRQTGAHAEALPLAQRALRIREKSLGPEHPRTADTLGLLAMIYQQQGAMDKALPLAEKSLKIKGKELGTTHPETVKSQLILGVIQQGRQDYAKAEVSFQKGQSAGKARRAGLGGLAEVYLSTGRYAQALEALDALPPRARARPQMRAQFFTQKGQALQGLGRRGEAAAAYLQAIVTIEELRARTPGERASFFQAGMIKGYYQSYLALIGLLAEMAPKGEPLPPSFQAYGRDPAAAAFYFAESVKARALLEAMAAKARVGLSKEVPPDLAVKERQLQAKWRALESKWDAVFLPHAGRRQDVEVYRAEQQDLEKQETALLEELRRRAPRYAALYYPRPYKAQDLPLKSGEVLLEYILGDKESYLFRVEPGGRTQIFRLAV
ncbi:MAG: tetratricopeptide repeat protein, partial [Syntrophales bacterium]|nr:tetratricopeptide repeat protein [Syntrophales bacterium]